MSALSVNDPEGPRSHRYYAPRQPRVVAREATLQPVLERLRGGARDYSADERLGDDADPLCGHQCAAVVFFRFDRGAECGGDATERVIVAFAVRTACSDSGSLRN